MAHSSSGSSGAGLNRTPPLGAVFWVIMVLAVAAGQTVSDTINGRFGLDSSGTMLVTGALMAVAFVTVFLEKRYVPLSYWITVAVCSMFGNALVDYLIGNVRLSSLGVTALFAVALVATLVVWWAMEHSLSVQAVVTARQEAFYWLAFVVKLAFGTALSDVVAEQLGIGDGATTLLFAAIVGLVALAHYRLGLKAVPAFWLAFIFIQPMTNSLADLISQPGVRGGLGAGPLATSVLLVVLVAGLIAYETSGRTRNRSA